MKTPTTSIWHRDDLIRRCYTAAARVRSPYWLGVFISFVALALLVIFYQVVSAGVHDSKQRLKTAGVHERATMHCKTMGGQPEREQCFSQIKGVTSRNIQTPLWETSPERTLMAGP